MTCKNCGRDEAYISYTTRAYGKGDRLVVIENVPIISCRNCAVELLSADTLDHLYELRTALRVSRASGTNEQLVKVADFQASAETASPIHEVPADTPLITGFVEALKAMKPLMGQQS